MRRAAILVVIAAGLAGAGCGASAPAAPHVRYRVAGDRAVAHVATMAAANRACDAYTAGAYPELERVSQVEYRLPHSGGRDLTCVRP